MDNLCILLYINVRYIMWISLWISYVYLWINFKFANDLHFRLLQTELVK